MQPQRKSKILGWVIAALSFIGFADAAYLTVDHYLKVPVPCTITHGCEIVLTSQYSTIGPVPIALIGAIYYLVILILTLNFLSSPNLDPRPALKVFGIFTIGLAISAYLFYVQIGVLHAICQYCLFSAATTLVGFLASLMLVLSLRKRPNV